MILIFIGYKAYGDYLVYNGMIRYLLYYFNKIYYYTDDNHKLYLEEYYNDLYLLNKIEFINKESILEIIKNNKDIKILNTVFEVNNKTEFINHININNYYNYDNKIINLLGCEDFSDRNKNFINNNITSFYYNSGLNPNIISTFYKYNRNYIKELEFFNKIKIKYNIGYNEKYIAICELKKDGISLDYNKFNNKNLKIINMCYLIDNPLYLLQIIENAEEIHMFENSTAIMIYLMQLTNIINYNKYIYMHMYARYRSENLNDVYKNPILDKWIFIK